MIATGSPLRSASEALRPGAGPAGAGPRFDVALLLASACGGEHKLIVGMLGDLSIKTLHVRGL
jgi:hypothetical protein